MGGPSCVDARDWIGFKLHSASTGTVAAQVVGDWWAAPRFGHASASTRFEVVSLSIDIE